MDRVVMLLGLLALLVGSAQAAPGRAAKAPSVSEALASRTDLWGDLAMKQPDGASYEFFADLVPPLRYVNADFKHYPIVLSAPGGEIAKFLLVSNGSAINAPAKLGTWRSNIGTAVSFHVGPDAAPFGEDLAKLEGPHYDSGYLPIVRNRYKHGGAAVDQEVFAAVDPQYAKRGAAFVRFSGKGQAGARLDGSQAYQEQGGLILNKDGHPVLSFGPEWKWDQAKGQLIVDLKPNKAAYLVVFTKPTAESGGGSLDSKTYDAQRGRCASVWQSLLNRGIGLETPEAVVNNAWKSLVIGTFIIAKGDVLNYSWGNQYECQYEAECGDAALALLQFGYADDVRRMLVPLLDFQQGGLLYHNAAYKLQLLERYYWLTRDLDSLRAYRPRWTKELAIITDSREKDSGLLPKERYCGDIGDQVYTLNSNANCWRALNDAVPLLQAVGETAESERVKTIADEYRQTTLKAADASMDRSTDPPFVPVALFGAEKAYPDITSTMIGSYWNLIIPYVLGSGIFSQESGVNASIVDYLRQHGGLLMGMIRFDQHSGLFANENGVDDLYSLRYVLDLLQRDEVDHAQVTFYGKLAQGLTRDTFIGGEGSCMISPDGLGRDTYLPPCTSGNGLFLQNLRNLMVQDWDQNDDGVPDTLRLMFATPPRWLEDGKSIKLTNAPTAFGAVSVEMRSDLAHGQVVAKIVAPPHKPKTMLIRARVPAGWKVVSAYRSKLKLPVDPLSTVDITGMRGTVTLKFAVTRNP
jgi:hypothetical protein